MTSPLPETMNECRHVGDAQQRLEAPQAAVRAPVLGELDRGARQVAVLLQLRLESLEQRERVRRAAREARDHLALVQPAHLARVALHHGVAERDLAVAADGDDAVAAHAEDRRAVRLETCHVRAHAGSELRRAGAAERRLASRAWVRSVVDPGEVLEIKVRVDLRRADVGVAEQFLHRAQVLARLEQVRRERVPEHVRVHVHGQSLPPRPARDAPLHDARPEAAAVAARRTRRVSLDRGDAAALGEPARERLDGVTADRHDAGLAALAEHAHGAIAQVEVTRGRDRAAPPVAAPTSRRAP